MINQSYYESKYPGSLKLAKVIFFTPSPLKGKNKSESLSLLNNKHFMRVKQHSSLLNKNKKKRLLKSVLVQEPGYIVRPFGHQVAYPSSSVVLPPALSLN